MTVTTESTRDDAVCAIEAALSFLRDRQTFLVLREVFWGVRRFEAIRAATGLSRQVLSERLTHLVDQDVLRRHTYAEEGSRPRQEYRLTETGLELYPVLVALYEWGRRHALTEEQRSLVTPVHRDCGAEVHLVARCAEGHELVSPREITGRSR